VILELLGCQLEKTIDVELHLRKWSGRFDNSSSGNPERLMLSWTVETESAAAYLAREKCWLFHGTNEQASSRRIVIISAVVSLIVSLLTVVALTSWLGRREPNLCFRELSCER